MSVSRSAEREARDLALQRAKKAKKARENAARGPRLLRDSSRRSWI